MQINVSGHHVEVSPALHDYVTSKMNRIERHFEQITSIDVILSVEKQRQKAEATIRFSPLRVTNADLKKMHGLNESIPVDVVDEAVSFYRHLITHAR